WATPTECSPCLSQPVSSTIQDHSGSRCVGIIWRIACHTSRSCHGLSVSSCWGFCESTPRRSAIGSIDLRSPGSNSPSTYSAAPSRRSLRPIGRAKGARKTGNALAWSRQFASVHFVTEKTTASAKEGQYLLNIVILAGVQRNLYAFRAAKQKNSCHPRQQGKDGGWQLYEDSRSEMVDCGAAVLGGGAELCGQEHVGAAGPYYSTRPRARRPGLRQYPKRLPGRIYSRAADVGDPSGSAGAAPEPGLVRGLVVAGQCLHLAGAVGGLAGRISFPARRGRGRQLDGITQNGLGVVPGSGAGAGHRHLYR